MCILDLWISKVGIYKMDTRGLPIHDGRRFASSWWCVLSIQTT